MNNNTNFKTVLYSIPVHFIRNHILCFILLYIPGPTFLIAFVFAGGYSLYIEDNANFIEKHTVRDGTVLNNDMTTGAYFGKILVRIRF